MPLDPVTGGIVGSALGAGIGAIGSAISGGQSARASERNYKHRYQWQVRDLKKAGLNPMLSVMNPAPVPSMPNIPDFGAAATNGARAGGQLAMQMQLGKAQIENVKQDTLLKGSAISVNNAQARESSIRAGIQEASLPWAPSLAQATAQGADKNIALMQTQINAIAEQTVGYRLSNAQLEKIQPLLIKAQELANKGASLDMIEREVNSGWYEAFGASDKYGPVLKFIMGLVSQIARVK